MIRRAGVIEAYVDSPCVYFVIKDAYLYIGQTQNIPVIRWAAHVSEKGSFLKNLRLKDEDTFLRNDIIRFYGYECERVLEDVPPLQRRLVTQYIEHQVHVKVICHDKLGPKFNIISDTKRTAVTGCKYEWAETMAEYLVEEFSRDLEEYTDI